MCLFEYDEKKAMEAEREEGREEERENTIKIVLDWVRDGFLPKEEAAKKLGLTVEQLEKKLRCYHTSR